MVHRITHLDVHRTALILAICGAVVSLVFMLLALPMFMFMPKTSSGGWSMFSGGGFMVILMPVMYFVFGYIFSALFVVVFNAVAGWLGGIPVTFAGEAGEGV